MKSEMNCAMAPVHYKTGGFQTSGFPGFFGRGPDRVSDPLGNVPCRCFIKEAKGQIGKIPKHSGKSSTLSFFSLFFFGKNVQKNKEFLAREKKQGIPIKQGKDREKGQKKHKSDRRVQIRKPPVSNPPV